MRSKIAGATTIVAAVVLAATVAGASSAPVKQSPQHLRGTWLSTVRLASPPPGVDPTFQALNTFTRSGGLLVSSNQSNPTLRSLAQGEWTRVANRQFTSTFAWFRFDPTGKPVGMQRVRRTMTVDADGDSFQATDIVEVLAPDGTVLATTQATESAVRLAG